MSEYKDILLMAMMWGQCVESLVRDCTLKFIAKGKISPIEQEVEKIKYIYGLGGLAHSIKPAIDAALFDRLLSFSKERNEVTHRAADKYLKHIINGSPDADVEIEKCKLQEIVTVAEDLYGDFLDIHESVCN